MLIILILTVKRSTHISPRILLLEGRDMVVHAVELLGVQLAIVGDRWQELGGTRLKKLLIVLEGVAPLR